MAFLYCEILWLKLVILIVRSNQHLGEPIS
uniref:Uncharacterized protein n=1 Tax=Anguilla anguilla TaxID=7936 RepID=A0A0E9QJ77_ANGAN